MSQFKITATEIKKIANTYKMDGKSVADLHKVHIEISKNMKSQYLAHIIRLLEEYVRETKRMPNFRIQCQPMKRDKEFLTSNASFFKEKSLYTILYPPNLDEKQLRVCIAHELGHLVVIVTGKTTQLTETMTQNEKNIIKTKAESLSSVIGTFIIFDKNLFYDTKTHSYKHSSGQAIIDDFILLRNREKNIYNISTPKPSSC